MLAHKCHQDTGYSLSAWSAVTGIPPHTLKQMEREMLRTLSFNCHITTESYGKWNTFVRMAELAYYQI